MFWFVFSLPKLACRRLVKVVVELEAIPFVLEIHRGQNRIPEMAKKDVRYFLATFSTQGALDKKLGNPLKLIGKI